MIENHGVEVIFSHMHNIDLQSHNYMKYLKNRDTSRYDENEVVKFAEATYKVTDDYIGSFMHLIDEGWTIMIFSDHALISAEEGPHVLCENCGVNVDPMRAMGYTVLKKDADGNDLPEVDWTKTKAIQTRSNSIYINLKGRDPYGIVDPEDKYELEEQIITDLYGYKHPDTGRRCVSLALRNRDALVLGQGGPNCGDIYVLIAEGYTFDHGDGLPTVLGVKDTSVAPIFFAAGKGLKSGETISRIIRQIDIAPTISALAGIRMPADCEGAPIYQMFAEEY